MFGSLFWIIGVLCAVWVIADVFTNQKRMKIEIKILWTVLAIIFSVITAIVYYFVVKK